MNELLFFLHVFILIIFLLVSVKIGKEALVVFVCLQTILANLFVTKQIELFSFTVTCSDVYVVSAIFGLNLLQEYFGKKEAQKTIYYSLMFLLLFMVVAKIHVLYMPSIVDTTQNSFYKIFESTPRIIIASIAVFFVVQWFDMFLYSALKKRYNKNTLLIRMLTSSVLSQFIDTVLFSFLGLYLIVDKIFDVILVSFSVKLITIISCSFFIGFTNKLLRVKKADELL